MLRAIALYRKHDPTSSMQEEFVWNVFDCICFLMLIPAHRETFAARDGPALVVRMIRESRFVSKLAFKLTDFALKNCETSCNVFVEKLGLKSLFSVFMKKRPFKKESSVDVQLDENVLSIIESLCKMCTGQAVARVLSKFTECNFEKIERLLELHDIYQHQVEDARVRLRFSSASLDNVKRELREENEAIDPELDEVTEYLQLCDKGLGVLEKVDAILIRLCNMGNQQVANNIVKLLKVKGVKLSEIKKVLEDMCAREENDENSSLRKSFNSFFSDPSVFS
eukprot:GHVL01017543.1.p1 GENE.GHVL01017543.1~~GHVL01017543.1.p1  ORF type:complete len:281 (-),score=45.35 GHVL01017543.1:376-1218(-)